MSFLVSGLFFGLGGWSQLLNDQSNANFISQFNNSNSVVVGYTVERSNCYECFCPGYKCGNSQCTIFNWKARTINQYVAWSNSNILTLNVTGPKDYCGISADDAIAGAPGMGSTVWISYNISNPNQTTYWLTPPNLYVDQRNGLFAGGSVFAFFAIVMLVGIACT